jgi:ribosomal peptide maturation radical SAM protein 1
MRYRSKSPDRVYNELVYLYRRYGYSRIDSVDNILDHRYIHSVFPRLVENGIQLEMFYEVKSNLKYAQLAAMRRGGVKLIQPGIESFSNDVLKLMKKGVTGLQNLQLLKWCEEIGIVPAWNLLAGFPDEAPEDYASMAKLLSVLTHLEPPTGCSPIRLDRFSPLLNEAEAFGLKRVRPARAYYYVFPLSRRELARLAYFFDFDYADGRNVEAYLGAIHAEVDKWRNSRFQAEEARRPRLDATIKEGGSVHILDTRGCATSEEHCLAGLHAEVLLSCDSAQRRHALVKRYGVCVEDALHELLLWQLCVEMDGQILSLPVLRNRPPQMMETQFDSHDRIPTAADPKSLLHIL